ncbi:MAG: OmpH family outer membrane protein [Proteobacteria bacterium]|nr:OmpH family outer membrane protein [Pseudomonadota bacterium]
MMTSKFRLLPFMMFSLCFSMAVSFGSAFGFDKSQFKLGLIDNDRLFRTLPYKAVGSQLVEEKRKEYAPGITQLENQLADILAKLNDAAESVGDLLRLTQEKNDTIMRLQEQRNQWQNELSQIYDVVMGEMIKDLRPFIRELAEAHGLTAVYSRQNTSILYLDESYVVELTDEILKLYFSQPE